MVSLDGCKVSRPASIRFLLSSDSTAITYLNVIKQQDFMYDINQMCSLWRNKFFDEF